MILLDEPTAHLDADSSALVQDVIRELAGQRTVIVVTHRPELLEHADARLELLAVSS